MNGILAAIALAVVGQLPIYHDGWIDFNKNGVRDVYEDASRTTKERVHDLLARMRASMGSP